MKILLELKEEVLKKLRILAGYKDKTRKKYMEDILSKHSKKDNHA